MNIKKLNTLDASMLVMGSMIGSGIFLVSSEIARSLGSTSLLLATWILSAFLTITGAYAYSKLSTEFPKTGGQYIYLKEAYSPLMGFLFGWSTFLVIQTGTIAAVAVAFAKYTGYLFPELINTSSIAGTFINTQTLLAVISIIILTLINLRGVTMASLVQNLFTFTKIASLIFLLGLGIYIGFQNNWINLENIWQTPKSFIPTTNNFTNIGGLTTLSVFGAAMIGPLFSSSAWNNLTFASQDFENPKTTVSRGLVYGTVLVCLIYFLTNIAYLGILPFEGNPNGTDALSKGIMFAEQDRIGSAALEVALGPIGAVVMAVMIMISTFGCNNGIILSGGRLFEAMSIDKLFFKNAAIQNKNGVPKYSLVIQCIWACLLCFSGSYNDLLDFTVFAILIFYFLTVLILFNQKIYQNKLNLNQKLLFACYLTILVAIAGNLLLAKTFTSSIGLIIVLSGIPVYYIFKRSLN